MSERSHIAIRELGVEDIELLLQWRMEVLGCVFADVDGWDAAQLREENLRYYEQALGTTHHAFIAALDGTDVGCGAICLHDEMPSPDNVSGTCAYIMNVYTREQARGQGVATAIMDRLIGEARSRGAEKIYLEASAAGTPLYASLGFEPIEGMMRLADTTDDEEQS